jgi:hypothetical protein
VAYTSVELQNIDVAHDTPSNDEQHAGQEVKIRRPRKLLSAATLGVVALDIGTSLLSLTSSSSLLPSTSKMANQRQRRRVSVCWKQPKL